MKNLIITGFEKSTGKPVNRGLPEDTGPSEASFDESHDKSYSGYGTDTNSPYCIAPAAVIRSDSLTLELSNDILNFCFADSSRWCFMLDDAGIRRVVIACGFAQRNRWSVQDNWGTEPLRILSKRQLYFSSVTDAPTASRDFYGWGEVSFSSTSGWRQALCSSRGSAKKA